MENNIGGFTEHLAWFKGLKPSALGSFKAAGSVKGPELKRFPSILPLALAAMVMSVVVLDR